MIIFRNILRNLLTINILYSPLDADLIESPYNHIYGRLPLPTRGYIPTPRSMYIGEWD